MSELIWVITGVSAVVVVLATSVFITAARVAALERKEKARSAYRQPHSSHLAGRAMDIHLSDSTTSAIIKKMKEEERRRYSKIKPVEDKPEDGADLQLVQWDYELWKQNPEGWRPITRDGTYVYQLTDFYPASSDNYNLVGVIDAGKRSFTNAGSFSSGEETSTDITHMRRVV